MGRNSLEKESGDKVIVPLKPLCSVSIFSRLTSTFIPSIFSSLTNSIPSISAFFVFGLVVSSLRIKFHSLAYQELCSPLIHSHVISVPGVGTVFIFDVVILSVAMVITGLSQSAWKPQLPSPVRCYGDQNDIFSVTNHRG